MCVQTDLEKKKNNILKYYRTFWTIRRTFFPKLWTMQLIYRCPYILESTVIEKLNYFVISHKDLKQSGLYQNSYRLSHLVKEEIYNVLKTSKF